MNLTTAYEYYFTSSNAKIFITNPDTNKIMHLDKAIGIGYSGDVSSVPIYTIGSVTPAFFSKGNFLGQGMLVLPFYDERYLKTSLQYVFDELPGKSSAPTISSLDPSKMTDEMFKTNMFAITTGDTDGVTNIASILSEFDITIVLDNSTPFKNSTSKGITLRGVKLISDTLEINSQQDGIVQLAYKFYFKDIRR